MNSGFPDGFSMVHFYESDLPICHRVPLRRLPGVLRRLPGMFGRHPGILRGYPEVRRRLTGMFGRHPGTLRGYPEVRRRLTGMFSRLSRIFKRHPEVLSRLSDSVQPSPDHGIGTSSIGADPMNSATAVNVIPGKGSSSAPSPLASTPPQQAAHPARSPGRPRTKPCIPQE